MEGRILDLFRYQATENPVYRDFLTYLNKDLAEVRSVEHIPFMPISFFKNFEIKTGFWQSEKVFESSGTTGTVPSRHHVREESAYLQNTQLIFEAEYGALSNYCFLALLPGYLERANSSLVSMINYFISLSKDQDSGFYLRNFEDLYATLKDKIRKETPTILWGVSHALMDFGAAFDFPENEVIVMETGGMKGKRAELPKEALHQFLSDQLRTPNIHSEYGMTELLSQLYSKDNGRFMPNNRMRVLIRPIDDPMGKPMINKRGRLDIIDLANVDTCSFIATDDLGIKTDKNELIVIGRMDNSDIRGCNLLYQ